MKASHSLAEARCLLSESNQREKLTSGTLKNMPPRKQPQGGGRHRQPAVALLACMLFFATVAGCRETAPPVQTSRQGRVEGVITYRNWMPLPPGTVLHISLQDISRTDAPAIVLSERFFDDLPQLPAPFVLYFDTGEIDPRHTYAVRARIMQGNRLLFVNSHSVPVITRGHPHRVEVPLEPVPSARSLP
jgi:putative lipoprotein